MIIDDALQRATALPYPASYEPGARHAKRWQGLASGSTGVASPDQRAGFLRRACPGKAPVAVQKRILVVDDDEAVLLVLRDSLAELPGSPQVVACSSGAEAVGRVETEHFDLVLTDIRMPEVGGVALTRAVRNTSKDTVVIWLTAYGSEEVREQGKSLGVYRILDKPLEVGEIQAIVRDAFEHSEQEGPCTN
jgi:CheY-like chemotaxis protein